MNNNLNLRSMIETALLSAIAAVMLMLTNIPLISFLAIFAAVVMTILVARRGLYFGVMGTLIVSGVLSGMLGVETAVLLVSMFCVPGIGAGYMIQKQKAATKTIVVSAILFTLGMSLMLYLSFALAGINLSDLITEGFQQVSDMMQQRGSELKLSQEDINIQMDMIKAMKEFVLNTTPAMFLMAGVIMSVLNFFISRPILKRTGTDVVKMSKFRDFKLPSSILPGILLIVVMTFAADYFKYVDSDIIFINLVVIFSYVFAFQGASTLAFLTTERGGNVEKRAVLVVFATILFVMFFGLQVLSLLGLMDTAIDIRKFYQNRKG